MAINNNVNPYYDDFDESKGFYQILFKPSFAVQARELTQMQTIIQDQIAKFGKHVFQQGSVVIPGNSNYDLYVPFVKIEPNAFLANATGKTIVNSVTGSKAIIKMIDTSNEAFMRVFITYTSGGGTQRSDFADGDTFYLQDSPAIIGTLLTTEATGFGSLAYVHKGVYFINGRFVYTPDQTAAVDLNSSTPSARVVFKIEETIVSSSEDETLLDPAQGSNNFAAPGADRLAISLTLQSIPLTQPITDDYVELIRFNEGVIEYHKKNAQYSELAKEFARRTFDESGNYVVNGFKTALREHKKTKFNDGVYADGNDDQFVLEIGPGKAYVNGFEVENTFKRRFTLDKGRYSEPTSIAKSLNYGQYIVVTSLTKLPDTNKKQEITFYDTSAATGGTAIGTARAIAFDYKAGDPSSSLAEYRLYITASEVQDLSLIGSIRFGTGGFAKVVHDYSLRNVTGTIEVGQSLTTTIDTVTYTLVVNSFDRNTSTVRATKSAALPLPPKGSYLQGPTGTATATSITSMSSSDGVNSLVFDMDYANIKTLRTKNADGSDGPYSISYTTIKSLTIPAGSSSVSISDGSFVQLEAGSFFAFNDAGVLPVTQFILTAPGVLQYGNPTATPATADIHIITNVNKVLLPKTKSLQTGVVSATEASYTNKISLGKADIYRLVSVFDGSGRDVTSLFSLDDGQRDYMYDLGSIQLNGAKPSGTLTINFEYFTHSGSGDFICVDSYSTLGAQYQKLIPKFRSNVDSKIYDLRRCLDFRGRVNDSGTFNSGASISEPPVHNTFFKSALQFYVGRFATFLVNVSGEINVEYGAASTTPQIPKDRDSTVSIGHLFIPPFCTSVDELFNIKAKTKGYKMSDIARLERRIESVEAFATLNNLESSLLTYEVEDSTGLNRFKSGYLVDNFSNPFTVCDFYNPNNASSFKKRRLNPSREGVTAAFNVLTNSSNYTLKNGQLSLPYTEEPLIVQNQSSRVNNVNPFLVFDWVGNMTLNPSFDNWTVTENLPEINRSVSNEVVLSREEVVVVEQMLPPNPPRVDVVFTGGGAGPVWQPPGVTPPDPVNVIRPNEPTPQQLFLTVWENDVGLIPNNNDRGVAFIPVSQENANAFNNMLSGSVVDPLIDPVAWTASLLAQNNLQEISTGVVDPGRNAQAAANGIENLRQAGFDSSQIEQIVAEAVGRVTDSGLRGLT